MATTTIDWQRTTNRTWRVTIRREEEGGALFHLAQAGSLARLALAMQQAVSASAGLNAAAPRNLMSPEQQYRDWLGSDNAPP